MNTSQWLGDSNTSQWLGDSNTSQWLGVGTDASQGSTTIYW